GRYDARLVALPDDQVDAGRDGRRLRDGVVRLVRLEDRVVRVDGDDVRDAADVRGRHDEEVEVDDRRRGDRAAGAVDDVAGLERARETGAVDVLVAVEDCARGKRVTNLDAARRPVPAVADDKAVGQAAQADRRLEQRCRMAGRRRERVRRARKVLVRGCVY